MKKTICLLLILLMFAVSVTGCKSKEEEEAERARRAADELQKVYDEQKDEYEALKKDIDDYQDALKKIDSAY